MDCRMRQMLGTFTRSVMATILPESNDFPTVADKYACDKVKVGYAYIS
jgi:hypothetical protein